MGVIQDEYVPKKSGATNEPAEQQPEPAPLGVPAPNIDYTLPEEEFRSELMSYSRDEIISYYKEILLTKTEMRSG